jgi:hypothetical protein
MNRLQFTSDASSHSRGNPQGLMNPDEVVMHIEQRNLMHVILDLLRDRIRQASKPAHIHTHR